MVQKDTIFDKLRTITTNGKLLCTVSAGKSKTKYSTFSMFPFTMSALATIRVKMLSTLDRCSFGMSPNENVYELRAITVPIR